MEISLINSLSKVINTAEVDLMAVEKAKLIKEIGVVKSGLTEAYNNFNFVSDTLLIDYYTYQIKAFEAKFEFLMRRAKSIGIDDLQNA